MHAATLLGDRRNLLGGCLLEGACNILAMHATSNANCKGHLGYLDILQETRCKKHFSALNTRAASPTAPLR